MKYEAEQKYKIGNNWKNYISMAHILCARKLYHIRRSGTSYSKEGLLLYGLYKKTYLSDDVT